MSGQPGFEWLGRHRAALSAAILAAVAAGLVVLAVRRPDSPRVVVQQASQAATLQATARPAASPQVTSLLVVHMSGEVIAPGVYQLPVGARIDDALKAAGGPTGDGDIQHLNLAARLADGQQIQIPKRSEPLFAGVQAAVSPTPGRVNLNMAGVAELDRLPGVGPVTAQAIVRYREEHGPFTQVEQLRDAKLVNRTTFEKIKDLVEV